MEDHSNHLSLHAFGLHMVTWLEEVTSCGDQCLVGRVSGNLSLFLLGVYLILKGNFPPPSSRSLYPKGPSPPNSLPSPMRVFTLRPYNVPPLGGNALRRPRVRGISTFGPSWSL